MNSIEVPSNLHATSSQSLHDGPENTFTKVTLREGLKEVPSTLLRHSRSIRFLDLSCNSLQELPEWISEIENLEILFASFNHLVTLPDSLGRLPILSMIGARGNVIEYISEVGIPASLRWLTLTDNLLTTLPDSIGTARQIQKVLLAGNHLTTLPISLASCSYLELLRISANRFDKIPEWILDHPTLSWVALAGNPVTACINTVADEYNQYRIDWSELLLAEELGRGASGITYKGTRSRGNLVEEIAVKVFNSTVSSDGTAEDELYGALTARSHHNLLTPLGYFDNHPESKKGLVYPLLKHDYSALASPPSFSTITRDVYATEKKLLPEQGLIYAKGIVSATAHLHSKNLLHGDLYAHNILVTDHHALLSDFGATLDLNSVAASTQERLKRLELRSLGILLAELSDHMPYSQTGQVTPRANIKTTIKRLAEGLSQPSVNQRPSAIQVLEKLERIREHSLGGCDQT